MCLLLYSVHISDASIIVRITYSFDTDISNRIVLSASMLIFRYIVSSRQILKHFEWDDAFNFKLLHYLTCHDPS